jgi:cobalt/nickel transport system permease protein
MMLLPVAPVNRSLADQPDRTGAIALRFRLALIITIGAACLRPDAWPFLAVYGVIALVWAGVLRVPVRSLSRVLGAELLCLGLIALPHGWERASFLMGRSLVCLVSINSVLLTLPPHSLAIALKSLPLPAALQETALLTGQYLEIAIDEVQRMQRAAACRGLAGSSGWLRYVSAAAIGALYVRSLDRAERVYGAMTARGYRGTFPITTEPADAHRGWLWATAGAIALLSGASYWV